MSIRRNGTSRDHSKSRSNTCFDIPIAFEVSEGFLSIQIAIELYTCGSRSSTLVDKIGRNFTFILSKLLVIDMLF